MLVDIEPIEPLNWRQIILDLRGAGIDSGQVSRMTGLDKSAIQNMVRGHEPRHSLGEVILKIHQKHCNQAE
jgi:hypothetical protein